MTEDIIDEIIELFSFTIEKASYDMKDYALQKEVYRKKLIRLFTLTDML